MGSQNSPSSTNSILIVLTIWLIYYISDSIQVDEGYDPLIQLPRWGSGAIEQLTHSEVFDVTDFGAIGDGVTDDTQVFADVWEMACSSHSKPTILIPSGRMFLLRPIDFGGPCREKLTFKISGAIIAPEDPDIWAGLNPFKWLYFHGVTHLNVEGHGMINGMGYEWWARSCKTNDTYPCHHAPRAVTFHRCNHVKMKDITMVNSQQMHLAFTNCFGVELSRMKVLAPETSPNTDGIHVSSSSHVTIKNSIIKTGDDCISIVGNSSKIRISDIYCGPGHGISIGSLGKSNESVHVRDVKIKDAFFSNTENGVRIKTWQGGEGIASKISFKDIYMDNVSNPIIIDQYYCDSPLTCENQTMAVKVEDISFMGIKGTSATAEAITFACSDTYPCEDLYVEDIQLVPYDRESSVTSFCWQAQGSFSGIIYPSPCLVNNGSYIEQKADSSHVSQSM